MVFRFQSYWLKLCLLLLPLVLAGCSLADEPAKLGKVGKYTPQQYIQQTGAHNAKVVPQGRLKIQGTRMVCGKRPTVLDSQFEDYGGAFDGFLILNPKLMRRVSKQVQLWIYAHECAHQFIGVGEKEADCFAVKRGRRRGWLNKAGIERICKFIWPAKGDYMHPAGPVRCKEMRRCFKEAYKNKKKQSRARRRI